MQLNFLHFSLVVLMGSGLGSFERLTPALHAQEAATTVNDTGLKKNPAAASAAPSGAEASAELEAAPPIKPGMARGRGRGPGRGEVFEFGRDVVIGETESKREVVVFAGNARIDGEVRHNVVVIFGSVEVNGKVNEELTVIGGNARLGPEAILGRGVHVIGGELEAAPTADILGPRVVVGTGPLPGFQWLHQWLSKGLLLARPMPPQFPWVWGAAAMFLVLYLGLAAVAPGSVQASVQALHDRPAGSFFAGALALFIIPILLFLLAVSFIGLLAIPFVLCAVALAYGFGNVAVYSFAGQQITRWVSLESARLPLMLLLGAALFFLIYTVPVLGFLVWGLVTVVGMGAVTLALLARFQRESPPPPMTAVPLASSVSPGVGFSGSEIPPTNAGPPPLAPTPDVALLPRVGFWLRTVATVLDWVLLGLTLPLLGPGFPLLLIAYYVAMWTWKGTSIGGIVMGIKIVRENGTPVNFAVSLVRSLSSCFSAIVLGLGFFWAGWDRERQAWHDKIAGTVVVRVPRGMSLV